MGTRGLQYRLQHQYRISIKYIARKPKASALSGIQVPAHVSLAQLETVRSAFGQNHQLLRVSLDQFCTRPFERNHQVLPVSVDSVCSHSNICPDPLSWNRSVPARTFPTSLSLAPFFAADRGISRWQSRSRRHHQEVPRLLRQRALRNWNWILGHLMMAGRLVMC